MKQQKCVLCMFPLTEPMLQITEILTEEVSGTDIAPAITEMDWSGYFEGINGAVVIYDPAEIIRYIIRT